MLIDMMDLGSSLYHHLTLPQRHCLRAYIIERGWTSPQQLDTRTSSDSSYLAIIYYDLDVKGEKNCRQEADLQTSFSIVQNHFRPIDSEASPMALTKEQR